MSGLRPTEPLALDAFAAPRREAGDRRVGIVLGPLAVEIGGLDDALAQALFERYTPYSVDGRVQGAPAVRVQLGLEDRAYFIDPPPGPALAEVLLRYDAPTGRVRYTSYRVAGWFDACAGGGLALLARGAYEPPARALENYVRSLVAWQAATRGGALVHAASAVLDGLGYLFYGESGAGKSTLSECNRRARVVSDDLSLLLPDEAGRPMLVGSPFRGTYTAGAPVVGTFPLRAGFRIVKDDRAEVCEVPRLRALGELVGNLPFVAEAFAERPDLFESVERMLAGVPLAHLHFRKDDSYWDAIRAAGY